MVGGDTAALINEKTGNVWTGLSENLDSVTPTTSDPKIKLGEGGRIAVTHDGKVYGYRPSDGMVLRLDNPSSAKAKTLESLTDGKQQTVESFTVIGSTPSMSTRPAPSPFRSLPPMTYSPIGWPRHHREALRLSR